MKFALVVSALGSLVFALAVAGVYEIMSPGLAVIATWVLKVAIGAVNIRIGHAKQKSDSRKQVADEPLLRAVA